ncbi:TipAS antibiotic-recognition domain-containing protein [Nocardioides pakistanensis]
MHDRGKPARDGLHIVRLDRPGSPPPPKHLTLTRRECPREMHAGIAELYVADPRYTQTYEALAPGLAQYVRDAVVANAART